MTERRLVFGEVAELYDDARARYPEQLIDDVVTHAGLSPGDAVLEVGAGTGIATRAFAARGLAVHVVEPSPGMAAVLGARGAGPVAVDVAAFERWAPPHRFPLLAAAQSWHWVDRDVRYRRAADALHPGGAIALFGHRPLPAAPLRDEIEDVYAALVPGHYRRPYYDDEAYAPEFADELAAGGLFTAVEHRAYRFEVRYDTDGFLRLTATLSDFRMLGTEVRDRLRRRLAATVDGVGGVIDIHYRTDLYLARRR